MFHVTKLKRFDIQRFPLVTLEVSSQPGVCVALADSAVVIEKYNFLERVFLNKVYDSLRTAVFNSSIEICYIP